MDTGIEPHEQDRERLRLAVEVTGLGTWDFDAITGELTFDERALALFGLRPDARVRLVDFLRHVHPEDRVRTQAAVRRALKAEGTGHYSLEYRVVLPDGSTRWVAANGRAFFDSDGRPLRFLGTLVDVTERIQARDRAEHIQHEMARLLETMSDAFYALDSQWRFTYVNHEAERLLMRHQELLLGQVVWETFPETLGTEVEHQFHRAVREKSTMSFETFFEPWRRWFEVRTQPTESGGLFVFFHDITEKKRDEAERERLLREYEGAVEVLERGDAVFVLDKDFRLLLVNENQERLSNTRRQDTLGRCFWDVFPSIATPESPYWVEYHRVVEQRVPVRFDAYYAPLDLWTSVSAYPTREGGIAVFFRDITETKRAEQFRERLLGIVSHDLRNPLSHIALTTQHLLRREEVPEAVLAGIRRIATSTDRMARMIDDLLDFTRASVGGGIPLQRRTVDLCTLVGDTVAEFELTHPGRVALSCARGVHQGIWDPDRLAQVVSNLVGNALTHGGEHTLVRVELRSEGPDALLTVHNAGPPIPPDLLPHIFDPFKGTGRDAGRRGLGLGLYIVQQLVQTHGGAITVESSEAGGTTFRVRLPYGPGHPEAAPPR